MFRTPFSLYRVFSFAEAVTWAGLITALIVRAVSDAALAVTIAGGIHGFVFLGYVVSTVLVAKNLRWHPGVTGLALIAAIVPFVTIPAEIWLHRTRRLEGPWRLEPSEDPRDARWHDRLMRWLLRHPWVFAVLIGILIIAVFTVLVIIGPPGGGS